MSVASISPASRKRSAFRLKVPFWFGKDAALVDHRLEVGLVEFQRCIELHEPFVDVLSL